MKIAIIAAILSGLALTLPSTAQARSDVSIHFGIPFYDYNVGPGYVYRSGYGWYDDDDYDFPYYDDDPEYDDDDDYDGTPVYRHYDRRYTRYRTARRLSCSQARREVRGQGYRNVSTVECNGKTYTFRGSRHGHRYRVLVNSRTGAVWRG